jgi:hypothetical protein
MKKSNLALADASSISGEGRQMTAPSMAPHSLVGICLSSEHPILPGRTLIGWDDDDEVSREAWLPRLRGVLLRPGDRVLLTAPANHGEPVVLGVLDGLEVRRPGAPADAGPLVRLGQGEALRVASADGTPLLEVGMTDAGPEVRLLVNATGIQVPGKLRFSADDLEFEARQGEVRVNASGDVKVTGEVIRLN